MVEEGFFFFFLFSLPLFKKKTEREKRENRGKDRHQKGKKGKAEKKKEIDRNLFHGVCIICHIAKVFNMWRTDLFILSVSSNHKAMNISRMKTDANYLQKI
jgi:hypothetical protein